MTIARRNLGPRLAAGILKPRPGSLGHDRPEREPVAPGPMASDENVERVAALTAGGMNFYAAFRQVMQEVGQ